MIEAAPYLIKPWVSAKGCSMQGLVVIIVIVWVWIFKIKLRMKKPTREKRDQIKGYVKKVMTKLRDFTKK